MGSSRVLPAAILLGRAGRETATKKPVVDSISVSRLLAAWITHPATRSNAKLHVTSALPAVIDGGRGAGVATTVRLSGSCLADSQQAQAHGMIIDGRGRGWDQPLIAKLFDSFHVPKDPGRAGAANADW